MSFLNEMVERARSDYIRQLVAVNKRNPVVLFDTINPLVCPAAPVTAIFTEADCHAFLEVLTDKINKLKDNMPPPLWIFDCY